MLRNLKYDVPGGHIPGSMTQPCGELYSCIQTSDSCTICPASELNAHQEETGTCQYKRQRSGKWEIRGEISRTRTRQVARYQAIPYGNFHEAELVAFISWHRQCYWDGPLADLVSLPSLTKNQISLVHFQRKSKTVRTKSCGSWRNVRLRWRLVRTIRTLISSSRVIRTPEILVRGREHFCAKGFS